MFLMELDEDTMQLTAKQWPNKKLKMIRAKVTAMGILQSPASLSLCKMDIAEDIKVQILQYFIVYCSYVDEAQAGIMAFELAALQQSFNFDVLAPTTPQNKLRASQHLMQGPF